MNIDRPSYDDVAALFKTDTAIGAALNISSQAVSQWRGRIPPLRVYQISEYLHGVLASDDPGLADLRARIRARMAACDRHHAA